jgi:F420-dependent oxidoreductase-like protein
VRLGLFLAYWPWFTPEEQRGLARLGDELGLDSVWISEAWGQDAVSVLGWLAAQTERIALGSGLMQIPARPPTGTAMAAASLDVLSGGRFRLGLGLSGPQVSEGWYGVPFVRPAARTREYVDTVRRVLAREAVQLPVEGGTGLGRPLKLLAKPVQDAIPVYLGAIGPRAVVQAGEIADGWLPFLFNASGPAVLLDRLDEGLARAGRSRGDIDVAPVVPVAVAADVGAAREAVRPWLAFYLGAMGAKDKNFYVDLAGEYGFGEEARACQDAFLAGDRAAAADVLSDELVDLGAIAATPDTLAERVAAYADAGADTLVAVPTGDDKPGLVRALAKAVA